MVKGDIFPSLLSGAAEHLAAPLVNIYNDIGRSGEWPQGWKMEYVTPIPKKTTPETANDLHNISCTLMISKVYKSFVLGRLSGQVGIRHNQYGGMKGCGTEHLLVRLWQDVLEAIEDPRAAALLASIDYSKAFNRLDFAHCLKTLKNKGASK